MRPGRDADELAFLVARIRRFFACWVALLAALAVAPVALAALLELIALTSLASDWDDGQLYAHPLALSAFWAFGAVWGGILLGAPVVLLRRHIVRPEAPFLRVGYLGLAVVSIVLTAVAEGGEAGWYVLPLYMQAVFLLAALIYVAFARRFRLFEPEEWRAAPAG